MKKLLILSAIALTLSPLPAFARAIIFQQKTNDGSKLVLFTNAEPVRQSGWVVFKYGILKGESMHENIGVTPYCSEGKIKRDEDLTTLKLPIPGWSTPEDLQHIRNISETQNLSDTIKREGWLVDGGNQSPVFIADDSQASKAVLSAVCSLVK